MATLSGTHTSTGLNYYTSDSFYVDLATTGFATGSSWTFTVQATSTTATHQIGYEVSLQRPDPDVEKCFHWTAITPSGIELAAQTYGPSVVSTGVEWTATAGATGCTDFTRINFYIRTYGYPASEDVTWTWTVTYVPAASSSSVCYYGTEQKDSTKQIVQVSAELLDTLGILEAGWWGVGIILAHAGAEVALDVLCDNNPPVAQTINESDWSTPGTNLMPSLAYNKVLSNFQNTMWNNFCQCKPATGSGGPPVSPTVVNWSAPTYIVNTSTHTITNQDIAVQINNLYRIMYSLQVNNNTTAPQIAQASQCCEGAYVISTVHGDLTGDGSIAISDCVGLLIVVNGDLSGVRELPGVPPYLWDQGWVSLSSPDGMLQEQRVNRVSMIWMPPHAKLATSFGYHANPGVSLSIWELTSS